MTENETNSQELKSKYNAAIAQLYRLDELWKDAHKHARMHQYQAWNLDLDAVWRELAETEEPGSDNVKDYDKVNSKVIKSGVNLIPQTIGFKPPSMAYRLQLGKIYYALNQKEIFLRQLQHAQGKGTQYAESDDEYD